MALEEKIKERRAKVAVIGLGYVGLPLACEFAKAGFKTLGVDLDERRVDALNEGRSYIGDVEDEEVARLVEEGLLEGTCDYGRLADVDAVSICVPTPLRKGTKEPDITYILDATNRVAETLHRGQIIVLESTTYPGTTEEEILPVLERRGLRVGEDFYLAFSPERVDPGNPVYKTRNIPKVVGGVTENCTRMAALLYAQIIEEIVPVSSARVAETVKLLENTFRSVNIALANEMALICKRLGVDVWEVIEAAATKPFGFMPFYPGPGLGGHCIPIDPHYLIWKARLNGFEPHFINLAAEVNSAMPGYVLELVVDALNEQEKSVKGSKILVLGVAYKRDVADSRESPAIDIIKGLLGKGAEVVYNDPYVSEIDLDGQKMISVELSDELLKDVDCVVIITDHRVYDYGKIVSLAKLVVDTRNATKTVGRNLPNVVKL